MSNEEILEEIYISTHNSGCFDMFNQEVNNLIKTEPNKTMYDIVTDLYHRYVNDGLIKEDDLNQV